MVTEKVAIVIPALNEEAAIHQLLTELPQDFAQWVIVVDNGSTDATAAVAQRSGAVVASELAERGAVPPQARLGNWLVSRIIHLLYGVHLHDIGSFRVIRCSLLETVEMREMTYGWPVEMLVKAARAHYRIVELPIHYRHRSHGRSKVAGTITGSIKAAYYMLSTTMRYTGARRTHA